MLLVKSTSSNNQNSNYTLFRKVVEAEPENTKSLEKQANQRSEITQLQVLEKL